MFSLPSLVHFEISKFCKLNPLPYNCYSLPQVALGALCKVSFGGAVGGGRERSVREATPQY
jgi:hypothetical protein